MSDLKTKKQPSAVDFEILLWFILFVISVTMATVTYFSGTERSIIRHLYIYIWGSISITIVIFPLLFKLIFDALPIENLRNKYSQKKLLADKETETAKSENSTTQIINEIGKQALKNHITEFKSHNLQDTLSRYIYYSERNSSRIYNRGGAYLLIGCLIAFGGVSFFYFQTHNLENLNDPLRKTLVYIMLRAGTLVFVESIAFFFLKQYRISMEEYRYYDSLKRQRENQFVILKTIETHKEEPNLVNRITEKCAFHDNPNKMSHNETTQLLEANRIASKEADFMEKLIDIIKVAKK